MKKKEIKNLAQKIAKMEQIIQSSETTLAEKNKAEQEIMRLSSHVDSFEDMIIIDEIVQEILEKS